VRGAFLAHWHAYGGLDQFGYPLTGELLEQGLTMQYFERARFEFHPQTGGPEGTVLLSALGHIVTAHRQHEPQFQRAVPGSQPGRYVPETGHHMALEFLAHWQHHGGLPIYGFPISEAFYEPNPANGQPYLVQYFERARFEHHPEHTGTRYEVQLGMLGQEVLQGNIS
jgi:hypothetical protein